MAAAATPAITTEELVRRLAQRMASRYATNTPAAAAAWLDGIESLTENPADLAVRRADVWLRNVTAAQKVWMAKLQRVKLEDIKTAARQYGQTNFTTAVQNKGAPKYAAKTETLARTAIQIKREARQIPITTIEDSLRRVRIAIERWKAIKGTV
jgi:hypothetical protein